MARSVFDEYAQKDPRVSTRSQRFSTSKYPGFVGGGVDPKTGNILPPSDLETGGENEATPVNNLGPSLASAEGRGGITLGHEGGYMTADGGLTDSKGHAGYDPLGGKLMDLAWGEGTHEVKGDDSGYVTVDGHKQAWDPVGSALLNKRVICTELYRTHEISRDLYMADMRFTQRNLSAATIRGYHTWAIPLVYAMRQNNSIRGIMKWIATARAEELGFRMGVRAKPNYAGKLVRLVFEPICFVIGLFVGARQESEFNSLHGDRHAS